ncbi:MAG: hypothetical protein NC347_07855 [Clostridium sp.]|nr:hypothetical protein [Clostridium sp.]
MAEQPRYFEDALADFTHDMASGGAIRHLVESGYSITQIMERLDFPTPQERVEKTVYRYMTESGMLLSKLPFEDADMKACICKSKKRKVIRQMLAEYIRANGEENSYMRCPFGGLLRQDAESLSGMLRDLTDGEREYLLGIPWRQDVMYHRLSGRMLEIGILLAANPEYEYQFYFLKSREILHI